MTKKEIDTELYMAAIPLSEEAALDALRAATARGMEIGEYISSLITEALDNEDWGPCRDRAYTLADLDELEDKLEFFKEEVDTIRPDLETGVFPKEHGWMPDTTAEGARDDLEFYERNLENATKERADLLDEYQKGLDEGNAVEILEGYRRERTALKYERITLQAKEILQRKKR